MCVHRCETNGLLRFRMSWPDYELFNEWVQTSDPTVDTTISGYASKIKF